jgi:aminopeptidase N
MKKMIPFLFLIFFVANAFGSNELPNLKIQSYKLKIKPNTIEKSLSGSEQISANLKGEATIPLNGLIIDKISVDNKVVTVEVRSEKIYLKNTSNKILPVTLDIAYHGSPVKGLVWGNEFVYSAYFICYWMICDEDPGVRSTFEIEITAPSDYKMTASGNAHDHNKWSEEKPYASYLFGFAAGKFNEATIATKNTQLRLLGVLDNPESLINKFKDTALALAFFEEKSGVPLPHLIYTQVLVPSSEAQENNAFAVIGNTELDPILTNPQEDWSFVHELSHQWWGNLITCKSWKEVWLNEGITTFMTAAYKEKRWGKEAYEREIGLFKKRYQRAIDAKFDVPLSYAGEYPSLGIQRSIVYSKAALFMDALRSELGEKKFWSGLRSYTKKFAYQSVETSDFQTAMENSSGKNLSKIFKRWAY